MNWNPTMTSRDYGIRSRACRNFMKSNHHEDLPVACKGAAKKLIVRVNFHVFFIIVLSFSEKKLHKGKQVIWHQPQNQQPILATIAVCAASLATNHGGPNMWLQSQQEGHVFGARIGHWMAMHKDIQQ